MGIRRAAVGDATAIAVVHVRAWQAAYRGLIPRDYLDSLDPEERAERWADILAAEDWPRAGTLVATSGSDIAGFAVVCPSRDEGADPLTVGEIPAIYLLPTHWGTGLGRQLMHSALSLLGEGGYRQATLWVLDTNERAQRFYRVGGWRPDGTVKQDTSHGIALDELRYRRAI
jgi:GNAT superfamily N-acetyltransferase